MKRFLFLTLIGLVAVSGMVFAGATKEEPAAAVETAEDKELGRVVNAPFEMTDPRTGEKGRTVVIDRFKAAPMLTAQVEAGELPPIDERLPAEPLVLKPIESVGSYGGEIYHLRGPTHINTRMTYLLLEHLVTWTTPFFEELNPNVAKAWEVSPDARITTFYLREGMKWSDGTPFTADAIVWWFEHMIKNDDLYPSKPAFLLTEGNLPAVTKLDDTTVRFSFTHPNPTFLENAARIRPMPYAPAHYLEQFHPDFVGEAEITRLVREGEYDTWAAMFTDKANFYGNPDIPGIGGWIPVNSDREEVARFRRNPYYWKVDVEGNQLPYIDTVAHPFVQDSEAWLLRAMAGELTYANGGFIGGRANLPLLLENQDRGGYRTVPGFWPPNNPAVGLFNFGHSDPVKREVLNDRRFRLALIKAIDYDEVNEVIYEGEAEPGWPRSVEPYEPDSELFFRHIGRDVEQANALLDEMGLTARDREGFRLGPDGRDLTLIAILSIAPVIEIPDIAEFYRGYFEDVGIRMVLRVQSAQLVTQMLAAGDYDLAFTRIAPGGRPMSVYDRGTLVPTGPTWAIARPWAQWIYTNGAEGMEPPDYVKRLYEILVAGTVEPSEETRNALIMEAFEIWVENLLVIPGYNEPRGYQFYLVKENLRNFNIPGEPHGSELHTIPTQTFYYE